MNKTFLKIFILVFAILIIIILLLPNRKQDFSEIKVLNFEILESDKIQKSENITLLLSLQNPKNIEVETIIINGRQIDASTFKAASTNGRILIDYLLDESDFKDNNLYLVLEGIYLNNTKLNTKKIILKKPN